MNRILLSMTGLALVAAAMPAAAQFGRGMAGGGGSDWFDKADTDHDGHVTRAEFATFRQAQFDQLDRNRDGTVSPADFPRLAKARPDAYARLTAMLGQADTNGDGAVSRAEMQNAPARLFDLADADRNGEVSEAEYAASREKMQAAMAARRR